MPLLQSSPWSWAGLELQTWRSYGATGGCEYNGLTRLKQRTIVSCFQSGALGGAWLSVHFGRYNHGLSAKVN
jgi:hypothetical protein